MKNPRAGIMVLMMLSAVWAGIAPAQAPKSQPIRKPPPASATSANEPGRQLANQGVSNVPACSSCHGARGEGNAAGGFPRIAGQSQYYIVRQLESYADGSRENPVMAPMAKAMSREQRDAVGAYYAGLGPAAPQKQKQAAAGAAATRTRGAVLATVGDEKRQVQACANCHGPGGRGEPPVYPYLAGQHAGYLAASLAEWKSGKRNNDPSKQMPFIAGQLTDEDIKSLAQYYASQSVPPPAARLLLQVPAQAAASGQVKRGTAPTPTQGVGSEQGALTMGGGQGPGGGGAASGSGPSGSPSGNTP